MISATPRGYSHYSSLNSSFNQFFIFLPFLDFSNFVRISKVLVLCKVFVHLLQGISVDHWLQCSLDLSYSKITFELFLEILKYILSDLEMFSQVHIAFLNVL